MSVSPTTKFSPFRCPRQLLNEYILLAMPGPLEQLPGTPNWSEIWLSGTLKQIKICCQELQNGVKFGCRGHPNRVKFQS